jgi:hypothetical protein
MKKTFVTVLCLFVFIAGTAVAGTVVAMRGDGSVVFHRGCRRFYGRSDS